MQISMQHGEGLERSIHVELPAEDINQEIEKRLKDLARTARMNGFRPGKVPYKLIHARYASKIQNEVFEEQIAASINAIVEQQQLRPINMPTVDKEIVKENGQEHYRYTASFEALPEIVLAPLNGYTVHIPIAEITDADVEAMLHSFRKRHQTWKVVNHRSAQLGDRVITSMKLAGSSDKLLKEAEHIPVELGANVAVKELESALMGATVGETKLVELPSTSSSNSETTTIQKMMPCEVTIHEIAEPILPELNDQFAQDFGVANGDIQTLHSDVLKNMELSLAEYTRNNIKWQVMNILIDAHRISLPQSLVIQEQESLKNDMAKDGQRDIPATWIEEQAQHRVALRLIIGEIIHQHSITLDVARVQNTIQTIAASYEDPESVFMYYRDPAKLKSIENLVLEDQAVDWVLSQVQVKNEPSSFKDVTKPDVTTKLGKKTFSDLVAM